MSAISRLARSMWHQMEPIHAVLYFSPEAFEEAAALGYDVESRWPSYFAYRTAPLGTAGTRLATAAYYSFSPSMIAEHFATIWDTATPRQVLAARLTAVDRTYRALLGDRVAGPEVTEAAELARRAAESVTVAARPFAAANLDLPWPEEPHLALWHAATVLREHRGDGHLAALLTADLDPCESLVSFAAIGAAPVANFAGRGWSEQEWAAAQERLIARGLVDASGQATERGRALRDQVERMTDELAAEPWRALGEERAQRLVQLAGPFLGAVFGAGLLPMTSTLGIATVKVPD
ncbi:SCO6745 family protein [Nonomuraea sp. LPB2021202275-12-8]|uniref:SCO6745 family protein n=1 Tax=Nonomuraea sp. LPB2021202275-12-8 TaxID=3120159 RepID=UPI003FA60086